MSVEQVIIGSGNHLSTPCHYLNQTWSIFYWTFMNKLWWNWNKNTHFFNLEDVFQNVCKMAAILFRPQCVNLKNPAIYFYNLWDIKTNINMGSIEWISTFKGVIQLATLMQKYTNCVCTQSTYFLWKGWLLRKHHKVNTQAMTTDKILRQVPQNKYDNQSIQGPAVK